MIQPAFESRRSVTQDLMTAPVAVWAIVATLTLFPIAVQAQGGVDPNIATDNNFIAQGASPILDGQTEGITDNPVVGAVNALAAHPSNTSILYAGAVNGGIWRTTNATSSPPTWTLLTPAASSLSIGAIAFDPTDGTNQTLVAGIGRFSSFAGLGGSRSGFLRTTDGINFSEIGSSMAGRNIVGVAPRGSTLIAAVDIADNFACGNIGVFRSTDSGANWTQMLVGAADALASDPTASSTLYSSLVFGPTCAVNSNGIYKSTNSGASWFKVSDASIDALLVDTSGTNVDISVNPNGVVYVAIVPGTGRFGGIFRSADGGTTWDAGGVPTTFEDNANVGAHPGAQGGIHTSLVADPGNDNLVYVGGDRQPRSFNDAGSFPNSIGALNFSGRLFRGDFSGLGPTATWTPLTHSGTASNSSPHADSRAMVFVGSNVVEADDGGIYRRTSPQNASGDWFSMNGNLQVSEQHNTTFDALNEIIFSGNQDTGSGEQMTTDGTVWSEISQGDGGDVASGPAATAGQVVRYNSFQSLQAFRRRTFNSSNSLLLQEFPALTVVSGPAFSPQFTTPVAVNQIAPNRIIFGGANGVYESTNRGDTISRIGADIVAEAFFGGGSIAAGGVGNADLLFVGGCIGDCFVAGDGLDGIYRRSTSGGALTHIIGSSSFRWHGVTIDPEDADNVFVINTGGQVFQSTNGGASFPTEITGNLAGLGTGLLHSIEFVNSGKGNGLMVGTDRGIFLALESDGYSTWAQFGVGLPNAPVYEMAYDEPSDVLVVGTLGGGSFKVDEISGEVSSDIFADGFESGNTTLWSDTQN